MKPANWFGAMAVMALVPTCWLPTVRQPVNSGDQQSAGIERQGGVSHLVFREERDPGDVRLIYVRTDAAGELRETIATAADAAAMTRPALAVAQDGSVDVVWGCAAGLCHAQRAPAGGWTRAADATGDTPLLLAAAAAPDGLHVAWQSATSPGAISYRRWQQGAWRAREIAITLAPATGGACDDLHIADVSGQPAVAVACEDPGTVKYARRGAGGTWRGATLHDGPATAAGIAVGAPGPAPGATGEVVIWCAGAEVRASAIVRPLFGPIAAVTSGLGSAVCAPGSAAVGAGDDGAMHAVFAGPIYYTDRGPAQRPLVYARFAPGSGGWTDIGMFCTGRAPAPLGRIGVAADASGVSVSWEFSWGAYGQPPFPGRVLWTQGIAGPLVPGPNPTAPALGGPSLPAVIRASACVVD
jgi:hypothetical protein